MCALWTATSSGVVARAYARASSTSAAVPVAFSFAPGPMPVSSRCAITTIVSVDRPGATAVRFSSLTRPSPGIVSCQESVRVGRP